MDRVAVQFSISSGGSLNGSDYDGVIGTVIDPSIRAFTDADVQVGDYLAEKRNDGTFWPWRIKAINSTGPLNIDVEVVGDHTGRAPSALQTGDAAISQAIASGSSKCYVPPFTIHGINSNLLSVFENLNSYLAVVADEGYQWSAGQSSPWETMATQGVIDLAGGNSQKFTATGNLELSTTGSLAAGTSKTFAIEVTDGGFTIGVPAGWQAIEIPYMQPDASPFVIHVLVKSSGAILFLGAS